MRLTRRGRAVVVLGVLLGLVALPALAGLVYLDSIGVTGSSNPGRRVELEVPEGATATDIGRLLERAGVIPSALGFRIVAYLEGGTERIQAGRYELPTGLTARDALRRMLSRGPVIEFVEVTFPEGLWLEEFARRLEEHTHISGKRFLQVLRSGKVESSLLPRGSRNFEGLLFPARYQIVEDDTALTVAQRLADEMEERYRAADTDKAEAMGYTPYEIITVASMVEAETRIDSERGKVARVIYNRLERGMNLGIDATVIYALGERRRTLTASDLGVDSPYNTRKVAGLPPTPIGAPGFESLQAAGNPPEGDWLYYVLADCQGHHAFSSTYEEFLENKAAYQRLEC